MKPTWESAPPWANWLAMDGAGVWYWYEFRPETGTFGWYSKLGRVERAALIHSDIWESSLESRK